MQGMCFANGSMLDEKSCGVCPVYSEQFIVDALRFTDKTSNTVPCTGELSILFLFGVLVLLLIIDASQTPIHLLVYHFW